MRFDEFADDFYGKSFTHRMPPETLEFLFFKLQNVYCHQIALLKLKFRIVESNFRLMTPTKRENRFWL